MSTVPQIAFEKVTVRAKERCLLKECSFAVYPHEKVTITGPSGSGKSSILATFLGFYIPDSGTVFYEGEPVTAENIGTVRNSVSYIFQEPQLGGDTVSDAILLPYTFRANKDRTPCREKILEQMHRLDLHEDLLNQPVSTVSGGEKQRIALARGLLLGHTCFILDEVTSALDKRSRGIVRDFFLSSDFTCLSVSHDESWHAMSSRMLEMAQGQLTEMHAESDPNRQ